MDTDRRDTALLAGVIGMATIAIAVRLAWEAMPTREQRSAHAVDAMPTPAFAARATPAVAATAKPALTVAANASRVESSSVVTPGVAKKARPSAHASRASAKTLVASSAAAAAMPIVPLDVARSALDSVGDDADAEAVWFAAINDAALSPHDRSDLIEDLNENGFADPDHVTPDELPLVLARLDLIEQITPDAMDETNAAAFAEAYKDLAAIADRLTSGG